METRLRTLFEKYFNKTASPEEELEFFALLQEQGGDEHLERLLEKAYSEYEQEHPYFDIPRTTGLWERIKAHTAIKAKGWAYLRWSYAVAILCSIGFLLFAFYYIDKPVVRQPEKLKTVMEKDVAPGNEKAVIILADGRAVDVGAMEDGLNKDHGNTFLKEEKGGLNYMANGATDQEVTFHLMQVPKGGQYHLVLADGTKVWLNAASSIRYPTRFIGDNRVVSITGEAYFEVAHNVQKPFFVQTAGQRIQVLGTRFNVRAYNDEADVKTTLLDGSVELVALDKRQSRRLRPGEEASLSADGTWRVVQLPDAAARIGWTKGYFAFNRADLETVLRELSRWYNVDFNIKSKTSKTFTGKIDRQLPLSDLMSGLAISGVPIQIEDKEHIIVLPKN